MPSTNRKHTKQSGSTASAKHPYARNTRELARNEGHTVSRLLWQKITANSSPLVQQMLIAFLDLRDMLRLIVPGEYEHSTEQPVEHKQLVAQIQKAEKFLTTSTNEPDANEP